MNVLVEWQLQDGTTYVVSDGGEFIGSGVFAQVRSTPTANGSRCVVQRASSRCVQAKTCGTGSPCLTTKHSMTLISSRKRKDYLN